MFNSVSNSLFVDLLYNLVWAYVKMIIAAGSFLALSDISLKLKYVIATLFVP